MRVLAKFVRNRNPRSRNLLITKTFGKFGAPNSETLITMDDRPQHGEWWYCDVIRESGSGTQRGLFILAPVERVPLIEKNGQRVHNLTYLYPGAYRSKVVGSTMLLFPKERGPHWILPKSMRRHLLVTSRTKENNFEINAIIVVHDDSDSWPQE